MSPTLQVMLIMVAVAAVILLGINLYVSLKLRKKGEDPAETAVIHQRLDSLSTMVADQLEKNRSSTFEITKLIQGQLEQTRQSSERATLTVHQQVQNFTQGMTQLHESMKGVHETMRGVSSFQDVFKSPKLRGLWGEMSLEAALAQYFPKESYEMQHYFKSGEAVDAILKLPNELILPIDAKFNWENFQKMVNAENDLDKETYRKLFYSDVKKKVDEISKYIIPSESTTDLALMYVPAETVYYEIINNVKDVDIPSYARGKRVFIVSPNTFALSISAIRHWFKDVHITKQTREIMKKLSRVVVDSEKLSDEFQKLGKHISNVKSSYDESERRVSLMTDRVKSVVELGVEEDLPKIDSPN